MPARKTAKPVEGKHYSAAQLREMLNVSTSQAYAIMHECAAYGSVLKMGRMLRVSESALNGWYASHDITTAPAQEIRPGRPRMGGAHFDE